MNIERVVVEKLKVLPSEKQQEVLDFIEFLEHKDASSQKAKAEVEFDEWAVNLAKEKGFAHLTEEELPISSTTFGASPSEDRSRH